MYPNIWKIVPHLSNTISTTPTRWRTFSKIFKKKIKNKSGVKFFSSMFDHLQINFTNLIMLIKAVFVKQICDSNCFPSIPWHYNDTWFCHIGCISRFCDDFALRQPLSCINDHEESNIGGYYVLKECPKMWRSTHFVLQITQKMI